MRIFSWNVNGIRSVWKNGMLQKFISRHAPDILCLQETKAEREQWEVDLPRYQEYWNSGERKGYSGTAIFVKKGIKVIKVENDFPESIVNRFGIGKDNFGNSNKEGRIITAEFENFFIVNVYVPNAKDDLSRLPLRYNSWDPALLAYAKSLDKIKPVILAGDFNVAHKSEDLARPKQNEGRKGFTKEERQGFQKLIDAGFVDTFRIFTKESGHYTWWTHWANSRARNIGWRIDYILVSQKLTAKVKEAKIHSEIMGSDHCPVSIVLSE